MIRILCDMDGVITDLGRKWVDVYNDRYDDNISYEDWTKEYSGFEKIVKPEAQGKVYDIMKEEGFYSDLPPIDGALDGFLKLCENKKYDVYLLTAFSGDPEIAKGKMVWLRDNAPFFDPQKVILTRQKHLVDGDVLIDDSVKNLKKWADEDPNGARVAVCFAAGHNEGADDGGPADVRVATWPELLDYLNML